MNSGGGGFFSPEATTPAFAQPFNANPFDVTGSAPGPGRKIKKGIRRRVT